MASDAVMTQVAERNWVTVSTWRDTHLTVSERSDKWNIFQEELTTHYGESNRLILHLTQSPRDNDRKLYNHAHTESQQDLEPNFCTQAGSNAKCIYGAHTYRCDSTANKEEWLKLSSLAQGNRGRKGSKGSMVVSKYITMPNISG